jgi:ribonucleoside-triphosphate reductase
MAEELGGPLPKLVTTVKPGGTQPKVMDTTEGCSKPAGRFIFNNVNFSVHDSLVERLSAAGYRTFLNPNEQDAILVTFPVQYPEIQFDRSGDKWVNQETAIEQLERYKMLMDNYVDHNCSITVSYDQAELEDIASWVHDNWDHYVGVSFLKRTDPTKTAQDLGYQYLPQEVVTREKYEEYANSLQDVDVWEEGEQIDVEDCAGGVCPVR